MVVDSCQSSDVSEAVLSTSDDRKACESSATAPGEKFLLNVNSPLQLGGRSNPSANYPTGLTASGFQGCMKDLEVNGMVGSVSITCISTLYMYVHLLDIHVHIIIS